ncbi:MAG: Zn-ribbon domain-containing OB-fold protein, partial [Bacteroidota bacterium]
RYRLEGQKFKSGFVTLANRYVDPTTGERDYENVILKHTGKIISYTIIHVASHPFATHGPFPVAVIETDDGARLTAQIADCKHEDIKIGARVELVFRKLTDEGFSGIINYGYKALLLD